MCVSEGVERKYNKTYSDFYFSSRMQKEAEKKVSQVF